MGGCIMNQQNINPDIKLTWEAVVTKFENLIKFAAAQQVRKTGTDGTYGADDLYQEGMIKLYDCWVKWCVDPEKNKDMDEFGAIFKKSLFRAVQKVSSKQPECIDLEDAVMENITADMNVDDTVERMYREKGMAHLKDMLTSPVAKELLQELIEPSNATLYEVWADRKRKEMIKSQGKRVNIPKDNTIRMKHIQRALGITTKQYDLAISEIRDKARLALDYCY